LSHFADTHTNKVWQKHDLFGGGKDIITVYKLFSSKLTVGYRVLNSINFRLIDFALWTNILLKTFLLVDNTKVLIEIDLTSGVMTCVKKVAEA